MTGHRDKVFSTIFAALCLLVSVAALLFSFIDSVDIVNNSILPAFSAIIATLLVGGMSAYISYTARKLQKAPRVFLSHSFADREIASILAQQLKDNGAKVWLDQNEIRPGEKWKDQIESALRDSDVVIALISSNDNPHLMYEIGFTRGAGTRLLPVRIGNIDIPNDLSDIMWVTYDKDEDPNLQRIVNEVLHQ